MTPAPAAYPAEQPGSLALARPAGQLAAAAVGRLLDGRTWLQIRLLVDAAMLSLASTAAVVAAPLPEQGAAVWIAAAFPPLTLGLLRARRSPDERLHGSALDTAAHVLGVVSLATILTLAAESVTGAAHPVGLALRLWLFALVYLGVARAVLLSVRAQAMRNDLLATPTLVVGAGVVGEQLVRRLTGDRRYGLRPVGFLDADPPRPSAVSGAVPVLGGLDDLGAAVAETGARRVILAFSSQPDRVLVEAVKECQRLEVDVSLVPRLFESVNERATLDHVGGLPLISLRPTNPHGWQFALKHALDRSFALISLVLLAPLIAALAVGVRLSSPGPVLFRQRRIGRDGRVFDLVKFRTMRERPGAAAEPFTPPVGCAPGGVEGEDRRTPFGRWLRGTSLDELPQLINVLRGEMSLIGPRPERPEYAQRFASEVRRYDDRHRVKSGITGWAQVNGLRGQTSIDDRVEWDLYYIQNWSLALDLRILALTIGEIIRFRG